jgi:formylglycine-generating enzyme required for sulfatase activity
MNIPRFLTTKGWPNLSGWLDQQPQWRVATIGVMVALALGLPGFLYLRSPLWVLGWFLVFGALGWLGWRAEPVLREVMPAVASPRPAPRPGPRQVRDGPLVMMALPGGTFQMGSPETDDMARSNEKPQHQVTVSAFRMAITPVTAGLYAELMEQEAPPAERAKHPAVDVRWFDAIEFCNRLSARQGYRPCYRQADGQIVCDWQADGYRLPTEAEWEYACRAGTTTRYAFGDDPAQLERYAWFGKSEGPFEVAQKLPNPWGLYDMHGNVWEWCWDWYRLYALRQVRSWDDLRDFFRPQYRVVRGGSFVYPPEDLRSAIRGGALPERQGWLNGFRCVRVPPALAP